MENSQKKQMLFILGIYIFSTQWLLSHQQVNVALKGIATQSSSYSSSYYASLAIDGNRASNMDSYSCTATNAEIGPWWRVDLLAVYDISNVIITNRADCCAERINGAEIHIGNSIINNGNNNPRCVVIPSIPAGASANYTCNMQGRYVNIIIPSITEILTLCEVEVYGVAVPVFKRAFLRTKFNSIEDLNNPTKRDKVLQKIKSANIQSSVFQIRWTKEPELEPNT
ncbi:fucolectin-like [Tachysurus fulvidraco]|uniref:fucolectin-like n=1 Tax=Tachysurus fulvidraco TaxID=1234273 RepID=UPI001FEE82FC|nr:fucolectin-like [Tachysurus fulvidraco]XP_026990789.2 fucolectin-like [Tachysurus fulvidraco]